MPPNTSPILGFGVINSTTLLAALPPLSLYIHIPWCIKKCPYCDFNSHESKIAIDEKRYIDALIADLDATLPKVWGRRIHSIFFGGGTPSLFSAAGIDAILNAVRARLVVDHDAEITMEANPGTFEAEKFKGYRAAGVNRLSIGIQSFNAKHLTALGRVHNDDEAKRAIAIAQHDFDNINLDIMFALPKQTLAESAADVDTALSFGTNHISIYHLTLEPNTLFHRFPPPLPDDDLAADMQDMIHEKLATAQYNNYETSAYAKQGHESKHNLNYWRFGDYIGIGAGAHGKISYPDKITREMRYKQPTMYMQHALADGAIQETQTVSAKQLPFEFMMNALRLTAGFPISLFVERTGLAITEIARELDAAEAKGLIVRDHLQIAPTAKGRLFLNDLLAMFLREQVNAKSLTNS
jgi:putative oxygen-independent coproporphyrinogen III oxidase